MGFTLDGHHEKTPCSDYQDWKFPKKTLQELLDFGIVLDQNDIDFMMEEESTDGTELFLEIVLALIRTQDPNLKIKVIPEENMPMFQFYGFDSKKRHIGYFGYGLLGD